MPAHAALSLPGAGDPVTREVAAWIGRALIRDLQVQRRNGVDLPPFAQDLFDWLAARCGHDLGVPVIGHPVATVDAHHWATAAAAARQSGVGVEHVRRLARQGRIRCRRVGNKTWLVDTDSLERVLRKKAAA